MNNQVVGDLKHYDAHVASLLKYPNDSIIITLDSIPNLGIKYP